MIICRSGGRFGNIFIRNIITYLLYKLKYKDIIYEDSDSDFKKLNIKFESNIDLRSQNKINSISHKICKLREKSKNYKIDDILNNKYFDNNTIKIIKDYIINKYKKIKIKFIDEDFIMDLFKNKSELNKDTLYFYDNVYFQKTKNYNFIIKIMKLFSNVNDTFIKNIINNNKYKDRYNIKKDNNKDIFIQIRTGDIYDDKKSHLIPKIDYYVNIIDSLKGKYNRIFICCISKNRLVNRLIKKYKAIYRDKNKIDNLLFGSTCKYIIMSAGSYSFLFGLLGFYSEKVYFYEYHNQLLIKKKNIYNRWYPDYFTQFLNINKNKYILIKEKKNRIENLNKKIINQESINKESINIEGINEENINQESINKESINIEGINEESINQESINQENINEENINEKNINEEKLKDLEILYKYKVQKLKNIFKMMKIKNYSKLDKKKLIQKLIEDDIYYEYKIKYES
jgi:hypothetical protein